MLEQLGYAEEAQLVNQSIREATAAGYLTADIGGNTSTKEMTDAILEALAKVYVKA